MRTLRLKVGSHSQKRYPRTGALRRTSFQPPSRPPKFKTWLTMPLQVFVGHYRRLRRERFTKPQRVDYYLRGRTEKDKTLAKELGIG